MWSLDEVGDVRSAVSLAVAHFANVGGEGLPVLGLAAGRLHRLRLPEQEDAANKRVKAGAWHRAPAESAEELGEAGFEFCEPVVW